MFHRIESRKYSKSVRELYALLVVVAFWSSNACLGLPVFAAGDGQVKFEVPDGLELPASLCLEQSFQQGKKCGLNALFLLVNFCDCQSSYEDVSKLVPLTDKGASLDSMCRAGTQLGLKCQARKLTPDELKNIDFPAIIHTTSWGTPKTPLELNHYYLVYGRESKDGIYRVIEPSTGADIALRDAFIARNFTGYCLLVKKPLRPNRFGTGALIAGIVANGLVYWRRRRQAS